MSTRGNTMIRSMSATRRLRPVGRFLPRRRQFRLALGAVLVAGTALAAAGTATASTWARGRASDAAAPARSATMGTWTVAKTVRGTTTPHFTAVTATSRSGAWAFEATSTTPAAWRLAGSHWARASFPGNPGEQVISAASTSPDDVWAVASGPQRTRVLLWNGNSWAQTGLFARGLGDVVALGRRDAWVFGNGAWHFNGHGWAQVRSGHGLSEGSALSPDSIWATDFATHVAHWDGHTWSQTSVKALLPPKGQLNTPHLTSIYAQSTTSIWAVGTTGQESQGGPVVLLHFNGHRWHRAALADVGSGTPVSGQVIPDGTGGLWIPFGLLGKSYTMLHYTSGHLQPVPLPVPSGTALQVAAAAAVPGQPRAIAVGGTWPSSGPIGGYTSAVILAYGS